MSAAFDSAREFARRARDKADSMSNPARCPHGSFATPDAHTEAVIGMGLDELIEVAVQRALDGGCTCNLLVHIGERGVEVLHDDWCPRLRTIGGRQ